MPLLAAQALSNTLWGLSKLGIKADELMEGIGQASRSQLYEYNSQNLANSVGGLGSVLKKAREQQGAPPTR